MATLLMTGGTGFVGTRTVERLNTKHRLVCLGRKGGGPPGEWVTGHFGSFEDLRQLDDVRLDAVVHLAAVTGGCLEREGILVNVEGTRCLLRYAAERGCRRFVLASSIAVVGSEDERFVPTQLPMTEDEPCADRHGYGLSKYLMEKVAEYHSRQFPDSTVFNLRFGALVAAGADMEPRGHVPPRPWWFAELGMLSVHDAVAAVELAIDADLDPGVHTYFIGPPKTPSLIPVADLVERAYGPDAVDLAHFRRPGNELDAIYSIDKARRELGFEPKDLPTWM